MGTKVGPARGSPRPMLGDAGRALRSWGFVGTVGCVATGILPAFMTGGLAVQISEELDFGEAALGAAVAIFFAAGALSSIALGRIGERVGPADTLRGAGMASAVCLLGIAVAAHSFRSLAALMVLGGLANAASQPAANKLIADYAEPRRQGLFLGIKQGTIPLSTLCGGLAVPVVALTVGWRWAYAVAGLLGIVAVLLVPSAPRTVVREHPERMAHPRRHALVVLTVALTFASAGMSCLAAFGVQGGVAAGLGAGTAGYLSALGSAGALAVYLLAGSRADRYPGRELSLVAGMIGVGAISLTALATGSSVVFLAVVPIAYTIGWGWPGLFNLAIVRTSPAAPGAATGITQTGAYGGAVLGPPLFGLLAEHRSYASAWTMAGVWLVLAGATIVAGKRALRSPPSRRPRR